MGRALAMMGIGVIDSVASVDEINKTTHPRTVTPAVTSDPVDEWGDAPVRPKDLGTCPKCGAPNAWSVKSNKAYCSALCWKK